MRERAGLNVEDLGAPMDVFWLRVSRRPVIPRNLSAASKPDG